MTKLFSNAREQIEAEYQKDEYLGISGTVNLCLNYCSASKIFPSHAALGQHQRPRSASRQQMFGKQPQRFLISFEVKCAHFHGIEVAKPISSCSISCLHVTSCRATLHLARVHVK